MNRVVDFFRPVQFEAEKEKLFRRKLAYRARPIVAYIYIIGGIVPLIYLAYAASVSNEFFQTVAPARLIYLSFWLIICWATFSSSAFLTITQSLLIYTFSGSVFITYINSFLTQNQLFSVPSILMFLIGIVIAQVGSRVQFLSGAICILVPFAMFSFREQWVSTDVAVIVLIAIWAVIAWLASLILEKNNRTLFEYEEALQKTNEQKEKLLLKEARSNQFKSQFLANMSHEIRTPLTSILGYAQTYFDQGENNHNKDSAVETIRENSLHLLRIVNDVLDLSKIEAGKLDIEIINVDLMKMLTMISRHQAPLAEKKCIEFNVDYIFPLPDVVLTDPTRLKQILLNLISNAIKFTKEGRVTLKVWYNKDESKLYFDVQDTGIGMSDAAVSKLFTAFNQADTSHSREYGGTGLGLYISSQLIERLGGEIFVKSKPQQGTLFSLFIKAAVPEKVKWLNYMANSETTNKRMKQETNAYTGKVLLADDHYDNRKLIRYWLEQSGIDVVEAINGEQAVEKALLYDFDLVLMDIQMPLMDGTEALKMIRANDGITPVIALTANAMKQEIDSYLQFGFNAHLAKPIDLDAFHQILRQFLPATSDDMDDEPLFSIDSEEFKRMSSEYQQSLVCELEMVRHAYQSGNWELLTKVAHRIKGSAGNFGFTQLTESAGQLESCLRQDKINSRDTNYQTFLNELQSIVDRISV
ncbi:ATP-binding protein [Catenovulum sediminis]|uniref:histidine kinase n=1 Tax=Catenovulum sediminis TaxID=1740262 RepID=A0ABV1RMV3_9ALTE